jgi:DNA-directed RNA polymerase specialized sigma24 family protein
VRSGRGLRDEFSQFYSSAYPELVAQSLAITGDPRLAKSAAQTTLARAWRAWPTLRQAPDPLVRTRWTAVLVVAEQGASGATPAKAGEATAGDATEDAVVVAALQLLPPVQRRAIVLHYLGDVSVNDLAALSGSSAEHIELLLDNGFTKLAETLDWADEDVPGESNAADGDAGETPEADDDLDDLDLRFDWTAEALADTAARLPHEITAPSPAAMLRRAALVRWSKRAAPVAACAACVAVAVVVAGQPASSSEAGLPAIYAQSENNDSTNPIDTGSLPLYAAADPYLGRPVEAAAGAQAESPVRMRSVALTALLPSATSTGGSSGSSGSSGGGSSFIASSAGSSGTGGGTATGASPVASGGTSTGTTGTGGSTTTTTTPTTPPVTTTTPPVTTTTPPVTTTSPVTTSPTTTDPTTTPTTTTDPTTTTEPVPTTPPVTTTTRTTTTTPTSVIETTTTEETTTTDATTEATTTAEKTTTEHSDDSDETTKAKSDD